MPRATGWAATGQTGSFESFPNLWNGLTPCASRVIIVTTLTSPHNIEISVDKTEFSR